MKDFPWDRDGSGTMMVPAVRRFTPRVCSLVTALAAAGCVKRLPPAPTPEPIIPAVQAAPPAQGQGRLVVDVVEGPTPVQRVHMAATPITKGGRTTYQLDEAPQTLCAPSPCVADAPAGSNVLLGFPVIGRDALEVELVHIGPDPSVYRRSLSIYTNSTGGLRVFGIVATAVGGTAVMTGAALLPIGIAKDIDGMTTAGAISLGAGAALLTLGILAMQRDAPTFRPGSANHYPLPAP